MSFIELMGDQFKVERTTLDKKTDTIPTYKNIVIIYQTRSYKLKPHKNLILAIFPNLEHTFLTD